MRKTAQEMAVACVLCVMGLVAPVAWGEWAKAPGARGPLIINEISPAASHAGSPWIELLNSSDGALSLAGTVLESAPKVVWELPSGLPPVPKGAFVLVLLDADGTAPGAPKAGPDLIVLHAPAALAKPWAAVRGELAVYRPEPSNVHGPQLVDYVAWGAPGSVKGQKKGDKGRWPASWFVPLAEGFGVYDPTTRLAPGASIGLYPGNPGATPEDWAIYDKDEVTPGRSNAVPRPKAFTLADGAVVGANSVAVGWAARKGDERYRFQLARGDDFKDVAVEATIHTAGIRIGTALPNGTYAYRVLAIVGKLESPPSIGRLVHTLQTPCDLPEAPGLRKWLLQPMCPAGGCGIIPSIRFKFQRKDTPLVCLHCGCQDDNLRNRPHPYCQSVCFPLQDGRPCSSLCADADISKPCRPAALAQECDGECDHGRQNCVRASVAMMASAYGACLSQDRIAYQKANPSQPKFDLGHDRPMNCSGPSGGECSEALRWALGIGCWDTLLCHRNYYFTMQKPPFLVIEDWIDHGRPIMTVGTVRNISHARVLVGYCRDTNVPSRAGQGEWVLLYDPWLGPQLYTYTSWTTDATWVGPPVTTWPAARVKHDECSIWRDSNNDGMSDFDSTVRSSPTPPPCPAP